MLEPFKYVGEEKYISIFETSQRKCSSCGLSIPSEHQIERCAITFFEVTPLPSGVRFNASLNGHKILDRIVQEPCRWSFS